MKTSKSPLLIAAAFTGLLGGAMARANAAPTARKRRAHRAIPRPSLKSMLRREKFLRRQGRLRHRRQSQEKVLSPLL